MSSYSMVPGLGMPIQVDAATSPLGWPGNVSRETGTAVVAAGREADAGDDVSGGSPGLAAIAGRRRLTPVAPPERTRVLVIANQKGGVGKTTTAVNLSAALASRGLRVLVLDLDPQGNASTALSAPHLEGTPSVYDVLIDSRALADVVVECPHVPGLFVAPATIDLAGAEIELVPLVSRESRLRGALSRYLLDEEAAGQRVDYVFIDCPPSLGLLTVNALAAAQEMVIPIQCEFYALEGLSALMRTIEQVRLHLNPSLSVAAIVLTMFDARTRLASDVAAEVRRHFGDSVLRTAVPRSVRIAEAPSFGQSVLTYDPASAGALAYLEVAADLTTTRRKDVA